MKKPLKRCCNGCDAPPQPPSWVLCAKCLAVLDGKMRALCAPAADAPAARKDVTDGR